MIALYIIIGIVALIVIILSVRLSVRYEINEEGKNSLLVKWAFVKINILPEDEEKKAAKKEKNEKKKKSKKRQKAIEESRKRKDGNTVTEHKEEQKKSKPDIKKLLESEGVNGVAEILNKLAVITDKLGYRISRSIIIPEMLIDIGETGNDAADTAERYGEICSVIFPAAGLICSMCKVRKYAVNIYPDYIARHGDKVNAVVSVAVIPRKLINGLIASLVGALNSVGFRLIKDLKNASPAPESKPVVETEGKVTTPDEIKELKKEEKKADAQKAKRNNNLSE